MIESLHLQADWALALSQPRIGKHRNRAVGAAKDWSPPPHFPKACLKDSKRSKVLLNNV